MKKWSLAIPTVQFLCVCVESPQVAIMFHHMFGFDAAPDLINCYIPSRHYMPVGYGQLGCSGFIVSDAEGYFVSRKTKAYLQYGEDAFGHVEHMLEGLVPDLYGKTGTGTDDAPSSVVMEREVAKNGEKSQKVRIVP